MQKLNEDNKNKNQLCHNAPGSLHYLEIVAPRIMRKRLLKQRIYFSLCQRQVRINGRTLSENRRMEITAKKHEASVHKQLGLNICVQNEF